MARENERKKDNTLRRGIASKEEKIRERDKSSEKVKEEERTKERTTLKEEKGEGESKERR